MVIIAARKSLSDKQRYFQLKVSGNISLSSKVVSELFIDTLQIFLF